MSKIALVCMPANEMFKVPKNDESTSTGSITIRLCLKTHNEHRTHHDEDITKSNIRVLIDFVTYNSRDEVVHRMFGHSHAHDRTFLDKKIHAADIDLDVFICTVGIPEMYTLVSQFVSRARPYCDECGLTMGDMRIAAMVSKAFDLRDQAKNYLEQCLQK